VILFRHGKDDVFRKFVEDVMPDANLLSLPKELYGELATYGKAMKLNFDDAYQYGVAKCHGLKVVTMDNDFKRVTDLDVLFL
jgi:predicted nucleic acid-binding protein